MNRLESTKESLVRSLTESEVLDLVRFHGIVPLNKNYIEFIKLPDTGGLTFVCRAMVGNNYSPWTIRNFDYLIKNWSQYLV